jgi:hypothetical protein
MTEFRYTGPPNTTRFAGRTFRVGDKVSSPDNLAKAFSNHIGFESIEAPKPALAKPKSPKKSNKPAALPKAEKEETSKE